MVLDSNLVTVALPSIGTELGLAYADLRWIVAGYGLAFGAGLLPAARAVDVYGARVMLRAGLALFTIAVAGCGLAPTVGVLLGMRVTQGLGAAMCLPASLALMTSSFADGEPRQRMLGVYGAALSSAFLIGVLPGGALTGGLGWRAALLIEAALAGGALIGARLAINPAVAPSAGALNALAGLGLAVSAPLALYGFAQLSRPSGGALPGLVWLGLAVVLGSVAWSGDIRSANPLVPSAVRSSPSARAAFGAAFLTVGTGVGAIFVLTFYLQEVLLLRPLSAGAVLAVLGVAGIGAGAALPRVVPRVGLIHALCGSLLVQALGVVLLTPLDGLGWILVGSALLGAGHFASTVAFTALATCGVPTTEHGSAMGMLGCAQQLGGAFGLALVAGVAGEGDLTGTGVRRGLLVAAAMSLVAALLVWLQSKHETGHFI